MKEMNATSRPEAAFVLLLMQATFWFLAGISALPFVLGGEVYMLLLAAFSFAVAGFAVCSGIEVVWRRQWARRAVLVPACICLICSLLVLSLPIVAIPSPLSCYVGIRISVS